MRPAYPPWRGTSNRAFIAIKHPGPQPGRDPQEGLKWYRRAAAAGNATAQRDLRALEAQGTG